MNKDVTAHISTGIFHAFDVCSDHVKVDTKCPLCKKKAPLQLKGTTGPRTGGFDYFESNAVTLCCKKPVGTLRAYVETIFGLEEDRAVLEGRPRVYY